MGEPKRIQLRRTKGWRKPEGAIVVARPTWWGNPFVIGSNLPELFVHDGSRVHWTTPRAPGADTLARAEAVRLFREWLDDPKYVLPNNAEQAERAYQIGEHIGALAGHDLACWCPLDQPCHADVLLELANGGAS